MPAAWIDAHCHLADARLNATIDEVLTRSRNAGVTGWIQGGVCPADWDRQRDLRARFGPGVRLAFGVHPWWIAEHPEAELVKALGDLDLRAGEAEAVGETGLDFMPRRLGTEARQTMAFEFQIALAKRLGKPLVLHVVHAHEPALQILKRAAPLPKGIVHAFSESYETARQYVDLGFLISVGGAVTRPGYEKLKRGIAKIPADKLVIETDAPDQTPALEGVSRERPNEPAFLVGIARKLAELRGVDYETILSQSTENLTQLLGPTL
jgi:TatD DNase family protein